jgi:hypothetical protein
MYGEFRVIGSYFDVLVSVDVIESNEESAIKLAKDLASHNRNMVWPSGVFSWTAHCAGDFQRPFKCGQVKVWNN